jgi:hypothetical protein
MRSRAVGRVAFGAAGLVGLDVTRALAQCAMCGTAVQQPDDPLSAGLFWSVVFLISLPYSIVGGFVATLFWIHHRSKRAPENPALHVVGGGLLAPAPAGHRSLGDKENPS